MIELDVSVEAGDWAGADDLHELAVRALNSAASHLPRQLGAGLEVSIVFTDDEQVRTLNRQWRDQDKPTNVLSFAANDGGGPFSPLLGDIVLAVETIGREADEQNKSFDDHLTHLLVHGFLHLVGYDHLENDEAEEMEALETLILASLDIANPYQ